MNFPGKWGSLLLKERILLGTYYVSDIVLGNDDDNDDDDGGAGGGDVGRKINN